MQAACFGASSVTNSLIIIIFSTHYIQKLEAEDRCVDCVVNKEVAGKVFSLCFRKMIAKCSYRG